MNHRYDFIYLFDAQDANPNGDPDAGNLPRIDPETGHGLVTDVCLKRKIRNFVQTTHLDDQHDDRSNPERAFEIYVREKAVLNLQHTRAYTAKGLKPEKRKLPKKAEDALSVKNWMCANFYDVRGFGAVMSTDVNCGQVRGPVQLSFSRSIDPIITSEHTITRMAVTTEREAETQQGDNRTMGRKFTVPYALYRTHGTVNPFLADQTGFTEEGEDSDLELLFQSLEKAFDFDASAARPAGSMAARILLVFKHEKKLGNTHAHQLFDRLKIESFEQKEADERKPPRTFDAYRNRITFDGTQIDDFIRSEESKEIGDGVTLTRRL